MTTTRPVVPLRSVLYMPGANARALEKAKTLDADVVIFDLEDAVAPEQKELARQQIVSAINEAGGLAVGLSGKDANLIRADKTDAGKTSLRLKRKRAAWDDDVRMRMLGLQPL